MFHINPIQHSAYKGGTGGSQITGSRKPLEEGIGSARRSLQERMENFPLRHIEHVLQKQSAEYSFERLHALKEILREMGRLETAGKPVLDEGKRNIKLVPNSGGAYEAFSDLLKLSDQLRIDVIDRGGDKLVLYSHKAAESTFAKLLRAGGHIYLEPPQCSHNAEVLARIDEAAEALRAREGLSELEIKTRSDDLIKLKSLIVESESARLSIFDPGGKDSAAKKPIRKIESAIEEIKQARRDEAEENLKSFKDGISGCSCKDWPLKREEAHAIASIILDKGGEGANGKFSSFLLDYAEELRRSTGVETLQFSSSELMLLLVKSLRQGMANAVGREVPEHRINAAEMALERMATELEAIHSITKGIDSTMDQIASGKISVRDKKKLFEAICSIGESRRLLHYKLESVRDESKKATFEEYEKATSLIVATIGHNLLRTGKREADLWESFLADYGRTLSKELGGEYDSGIKKRIENFISKVEKDSSLLPPASEKKRKIKDRISLLEDQILSQIEALKVHNPHAASVMRGMVEEAKTHLFYKFGGMQAMCGEMCYYLTPEKLLLASEGPRERLQKLVENNNELFSLFDKWGMSEKIISHLGRFNHLEANAVDSDQKIGKLIDSKGTTGAKLEIRYSVDTEIAAPQEGNGKLVRKITAISERPKFTAPFTIPESRPPHESAFQKPFEEVVFGNQEPFEMFLLAIDRLYQGETSAASAYSIISSAYINDRKKFEEVRQRMRDSGSEEFLLSFSRKRNINGAILFKKDGGVFENEPAILGDKNNLAQALGKSQEGTYLMKDEIDWYFNQRIARVMFHEAAYKKLQWAAECAERIALQ